MAKLGRNVAYWGMGAAAIYVPAGVVIVRAGGAAHAPPSPRKS